ncbi:PAS domain-containing protein [Bdellovibrio bacteriovorus]|uniref:PAS domain-containing protein n=1 Tax=Bdellovibrio bacteriovorus TaxID=959 RepID=UPI0021D1C785|nr:PAS domain-containing protein [Bdellovibrio bacteriovorus]UXR65564.1 PAS domain-containing protein [Bdellovibrio bacteriovorus]
MVSLEADFALHELFFSKTDFKGLIQTGNKVFLRVSEYHEDEILRRPHNIIRHPDMPRCVFKLFWSFLKSNRPICAYVKNQSKSGRFYWVFAMAFPMGDGYLSIRLKPSTALMCEIQTVYADILKKEHEGASMDDATAELLKVLQEKGFSSYEDFMNEALLAEMKSRDGLLTLTQENLLPTSTSASGLLEGLLMASRACTETARNAFRVADQLSERTHTLKAKSQAIDEICREVQMVTTNLTISAAKLGEVGKPLGVVSNNLEKLAQDILSNSLEFEKTFTSFHQATAGMYLAIGISRFQIEMMNHLIEETLHRENANSTIDEKQEQLLVQNCDLLKQLISANFTIALATAKELTTKNKSLIRSISMLSKVTAGMDVICVVGKIEMSRVKELSSSLDALLGDMEDLTESFKKILRAIESESKWGLGLSNELREQLLFISQNLRKVDRAITA